MEPKLNHSLEQRYLKVRSEIRRLAAGRSEPELLVVSKGHGLESLQCLHQLGQKYFGENYAQELLAKASAWQAPGLSWIYIGHLQSNKIKKIVKIADQIQTVSSLKHAHLIAEAAAEFGKTPYPIWIEVNADAEDSKHGCPLDHVLDLVAELSKIPELKICGLMAIPPNIYQDSTVTEVPALYHQLRKLADQIGEKKLSLGMSGDLELAIRGGSNLVRIGTAILGPRQV